MIDLGRWREIGKFFAAEIPEINSFIYGASDEDIRAKVDKLDQNEFPVLVGILPSIFGIGTNFDQMGHESPLFYYCMVSKNNMSDSETDEAWDNTLEGIKGIEKAVKDNVENPDWLEFYHAKPDTIHIDPEYDMWGLMGWSIRFEITYGDE
jgi:hypothetical protein